MSANAPPCLPHARRALLIAGLSGLAASGAGYTAHTAVLAAAGLDPIFAALEAERRAFDCYGEAVAAFSRAEEALFASEWRREPRVLVGYFTAAVRGRDFEPIPLAEQVAEPIYVHDGGAIDADCDAHARSPGADHVAVEARRARLHRELAEDTAAIATAPVAVRYAAAEAANNASADRWHAARDAMLAIVPTTPAGLLALAKRAEHVARDNLDADAFLDAFVAAVRHLHDGEAL